MQQFDWRPLVIGLVVVSLSVLVGVPGYLHATRTVVRPPPPPPAVALRPSPVQPAEAWASLPPNRWPQLVLTNRATFRGHSDLTGASAFLVRMPRGGPVLVGTAKHLIGPAGGVEPPVGLAAFNADLLGWDVYPRTRETQAIAAGRLAMTINRERGHDWLLLSLADGPAALPSVPLTPRYAPAAVGERVFLVGVPYDDPAAAQHVYAGTVTARPLRGYFTYTFTPPVHIAGFSGAPIVDAHGLLLGHGVSRGLLKQVGDKEVEFGGEDVGIAVWLWDHRYDVVLPPTSRPAR